MALGICSTRRVESKIDKLNRKNRKNYMEKLIKKILNKVLSIIFPFREPDPQPWYLFGEETYIQMLFRTGEIEKFSIKK
jgi:hypothetical protein